MKPIEFDNQNVVFAQDQPEYQPLPAFRQDDGHIVCCWRLTWRERWAVLFKGVIWHSVLTFNNPLQPQMLMVDNPIIKPDQP